MGVKKSLTASEARSNLYRLVDEVAESHEPVLITGKRSQAVLLSAEDWSAVEETLFLLSVPGLRESVRKGIETPLSKTFEKPGW